MISTLFIIFAVQVFAYLILGLNIRAVAKGRMLLTGITEFTYALANFYIIRRIVEAQSPLEAIVFASGCTVGCLASVWLTKHWD